MWSWPTVPAVRWRSWPRRPSRASGGCGANPSCCSRFYTRQGFPSECHIILRASVALVTRLQFRTRDSYAFGGWPWLERILSATDFRTGRRVVADFQKSRREKEREVAEEQERLRRYAGSS